MSVSQDVWDYIELSKLTKIPILLISNPGYGKTTGIVNWAKKNGYAYEQLIGSRFSPDDIMGYQVNQPGIDHLIQKNPMWFERIKTNKAKGIPTVLFCDEISTCSDAVQGSLLSLIFDRRIGNGEELPEDTIILAAANYSENLPSFMNIMAPTINRFCIINLLKGYNNGDLVRECLTVQNPNLRKVSEVDEEKIKGDFHSLMNNIIIKYSSIDSAAGYIDLSNHDIANIYKRKGNVYNIMSWRSISYLRDLIIGMTKLSITTDNTINNVVGGMIGLGSNNFKSDDQIERFINTVAKDVKQIIEGNIASNNVSYNFKSTDKISELINKYFNDLDSSELTNSIGYENALTDFISKKYGDFAKVYEDLRDGKIKYEQFINDMDSIALLISKLSNENASIVADVHMSCSPMYNDLIGVEKDFDKNTYGIFSPGVIKRIILAKDKDDKIIRVGAFGSGSVTSYVSISNKALVREATLSRMLTKDKFTPLKLEKRL